MPASRPKPKKADHRLRVAFNRGERALLVRAAGPDGLAQAAYVRKAVLASLGQKAPETGIDEPTGGKRGAKVKTRFSAAEEKRITELAKAYGLSRAGYIRHAVLTSAGVMQKPPKKRNRNRDELVNLLHTVSIQLKRIGTNANQMAHRHNAGLPIAPEELRLFKNQHQVLISAATAAVEKMLV